MAPQSLVEFRSVPVSSPASSPRRRRPTSAFPPFSEPDPDSESRPPSPYGERDPRQPQNNLYTGWHVPPGYSIGQAPDGHHYLVPTFMIDGTDLALDTHSRKLSSAIEQANGGVTEAKQDMVYSCSCFKGGVLISVTSHYLYVFFLLQINRTPPPLPLASPPPAARLHSLPIPRTAALPLSYTHCQLSAVLRHPLVSLAWHTV